MAFENPIDPTSLGNKIYHILGAPDPITAPNPSDGDTWFEYADESGNIRLVAIYRFSGGLWSLSPMTSAVFAYIDAGMITVGSLVGIDIATDAPGSDRIEIGDKGIGGAVRFMDSTDTQRGELRQLFGGAALQLAHADGAFLSISDEVLFDAAIGSDMQVGINCQRVYLGGANPVRIGASGIQFVPGGRVLEQWEMGNRSANTNGSSEVTTNHGMTNGLGVGVTPDFIHLTPHASNAGRDIKLVETSIDSTSFTVRVRDSGGALVGAGVSTSFTWSAHK